CEAAHHPPTENGAAGASRAAMFDLCLQSRALYRRFADELFDATGMDIELSLSGHARGDWRQPGILYVATRDDDCTIEALEAQRARGQRVDSADFDNSRAVWLPDEGQVDNRKLVDALRAAAVKAGVALFQNRLMHLTRLALDQSGVRWHKDRVTLLPPSSEHEYDKILLCAGAWSREAGNLPNSCRPPVRPVAGQMLALRTRRRVRHIVYGSDVYLVPRRDGRLIVGATMEETGFKKRVTAAGAMQLLCAACELMPPLKDCELLDHWAGLRPATPDGLPILGCTPIENLFVATGHFRNGILLTPITAQLMTECVLRGADAPPAFRIDRFAVGEA
ncbi:MAG: FAD-dependent oxidoreductase, partial [Armatimonadota bacterium]|nr:FAD-dependent oxidoreductase [Armatimonadota bacterium]